MTSTQHSTGWAQAARDADLTVELPGGVPMFFRRIPAGEFRMGARGFRDQFGSRPREEPVHRVVICRDFYLGTFPVTQAQYRAMAEACGEELASIEGNKGANPSNFKGETRPVEQVSWDDALAIGRWLTGSGLLAEAGLPGGWMAGLPSEAQWEYACRAGTETEYWNGDGEAALEEVGWYDGNSGGETHPVGEKAANGFGLHDMHGNVDEWCADVWDGNAYRKRIDGWEGRAWTAEDAGDDAESWTDEERKKGNRYRVIRGGSWYYFAWFCCSAGRIRRGSGRRVGDLGFRLCLFPGPVETERKEPEAGRDRQDGGGGTRPETDGPSPAEGEGPEAVDLGEARFPPRQRP